MKEQSQIDDMGAAVRGDRARAEQSRQRSLENVRVLTEPPPAAPPAEGLKTVAEPRQRGILGFLKRR